MVLVNRRTLYVVASAVLVAAICATNICSSSWAQAPSAGDPDFNGTGGGDFPPEPNSSKDDPNSKMPYLPGATITKGPLNSAPGATLKSRRKISQVPVHVPNPAMPYTKITRTPIVKPAGTTAPNADAAAPPADTSLFADLTGKTNRHTGASGLRTRVSVFHNKLPVETFTAYPYPVKPPVVKWPEPLPTAFVNVKANLVDSGYLNRLSGRKPHPTFGWRWQACFNRAVQRSGNGVPHSIATYYPWASDMVKWIMPELIKSNAIEADRKARWEAAVTEYDEKRVDIEMAATRDGLYPIPMKRRPAYTCQTNLPPGNWWIVGTHKVPGLTYYWNQPVTVQPGEMTTVTLTDANAMIIQGAW